MTTAIITILILSLLVVSVAYLRTRRELKKYKPLSRVYVWQGAVDQARYVFKDGWSKPQEIDDYILAVIQSKTEAK